MQGAYFGLSMGLWVVGTAVIAVQLIRFLQRKLISRHRFHIMQKNRDRDTKEFSLYRFVFMKKLKETMEIAGVGFSPPVLLGMATVLVFTAYFAAEVIVHLLWLEYSMGAARLARANTLVINLVFALLVGSLPFFYVFFKLQRKRQDIALAMISVVQNVIGVYSNKQTLADLVTKASRTMPAEIKGEWSLLEMAIRTRSMKEALYDFARRIDNEWADDLADILLVKGEYGNDITKSLHKLVREMQTSKSNEQKRQAAISVYRIGTSLMVAAAFFVIGFNVHADGNNYKYYFVDARGKLIITVSLLILFGSMFSVILSGRKRI